MLYSVGNLICLIAQLTLIHTASASPIHLARQNDKPLLRVLPLGASITLGIGDTPKGSENGYRKPLRDELRSQGYPVNMVGCVSTGNNFKDREHEGHPGAVISEVRKFLECSITQKPNLVTINAGTNDALQSGTRGGAPFVTGAYDRMKDIVEYIFAQSDGVTILLSTILPNGNSDANANVKIINEGNKRLVQELQAQGKKIELADQNAGFTVADLNDDGTHPRHDTYPKMAAIWVDAFSKAVGKGWIKAPVDTSTGQSVCLPSRGPVQTQQGSGMDDGTYTHASEEKGSTAKETYSGGASILKNFHYAQLVSLGADRGGETDELIRVLDADQRENLPFISFRMNNAGVYDESWTKVNVNMDCANNGVRWGDVNGDGLDDFICISDNGDMSVSINKGGNPPTFESIGMIRAGENGATRDTIRLGDIDGDGRVDYCSFTGGDIFCFRNGGQGMGPIEKYSGYWQGMVGGEPIFDAKGMPGIEGVRLIDINGDFKADWVYVYPDGHTRIFINQRGTQADGKGLTPAWVEAASAHKGFPGVDGVTQDNIKFGRVYGSGRTDYIRVVETKDGDKYQYNFDAFKNSGAGGTKLRGDGVYYCDMFGRGHDDYLWVWSDGRIVLYENDGQPPTWIADHDVILDTKRQRKSLHFGDWDGDGLCDVLAVDKATGNVDMWKNTWKTGQKSPSFEYQAGVVTGSKCTQGWGVGDSDLGLRFADIDGDGRVDYLCMEPNGRTTGYLNTASGLIDQKQIKKTEGYDRANHRWVDVDGDGKADFIWVDKFTGDVSLWLNGGKQEVGGSSFLWLKQGVPWVKGVDRGANIHFARMSESKRADMIQVLPKTAAANTWYSECGGGGENGAGPDD